MKRDNRHEFTAIAIVLTIALLVLALAVPGPRPTPVVQTEIGSALTCDAVTNTAGEIIDAVCTEDSE
jgi:hypothetical protein